MKTPERNGRCPKCDVQVSPLPVVVEVHTCGHGKGR